MEMASFKTFGKLIRSLAVLNYIPSRLLSNALMEQLAQRRNQMTPRLFGDMLWASSFMKGEANPAFLKTMKEKVAISLLWPYFFLFSST